MRPVLIFLLWFFMLPVSTTRLNSCGINVSQYNNFLNATVHVPFNKISDLLLAQTPWLLRYQDVFTGTKFAALPKGMTDLNIGKWEGPPDDQARNISYQMAVKSPFRSRIPVWETQFAEREADKTRLWATGRVTERPFNDFEVTVETCVVSGSGNSSVVEVDVNSAFHGSAVRDHAQHIQDSSQYGLTRHFDALFYLLKHMEEPNSIDPTHLQAIPQGITAIPTSPSTHAKIVPTTFTEDVKPFDRKGTYTIVFIVFAIGLVTSLLVLYFCCCKRHQQKVNNNTVRMNQLVELERSTVVISVPVATGSPILQDDVISVEELAYEKKE